MRNGRKALRDPPPTNTVADGRNVCLSLVFTVSEDVLEEEDLVGACFVFDDRFLSFSSFVRVICNEGRAFFGLGGTTATGGS